MNNWPTMITVILNWMSKVSQACIGVTFLYFAIGSENSPHPLNQSILKLKLIDIWSLEFSSASHDLQVFTEHSHFLHVNSSYFETGLSYDFGVEVYDTEMKCVLCWKKKNQWWGWKTVCFEENFVQTLLLLIKEEDRLENLYPDC